MKLVANIQLKPDEVQARALRETLERCNQACDWLSAKAFADGKFRQFDLHKVAYGDTRTIFELTAQTAVRCIAKVADTYKSDQKIQRTFRGEQLLKEPLNRRRCSLNSLQEHISCSRIKRYFDDLWYICIIPLL